MPPARFCAGRSDRALPHFAAYVLLADLAMISLEALTWAYGGAGGTRTRDRGIMSPLL